VKTFVLIAICLITLFITPVYAESIPDWVQDVFLWYGQGQISEDEVLNAIKFLIESGIIEIDLSSISVNVPKESSSDILVLPRSWEIDDFEITLLGLYKVDMDSFSYHGTKIDNHQQYEVHHNWKNLLKITNSPNGCIGFDEIKLETDVGNIWDLRYGGGYRTCSVYFDPQDEWLKTVDVFDINENEIPKLIHVEILGKSYVFEAKILN